MITFIRGIIDEVLFEGVSIDVNGVGYYLHLPKRYLVELQPGTEAKIHTTLIHKEDMMKLFGFQSKEERELFNLFISVSGIGAKTALGLLSTFTANEMVSAIYANDAKKLAKAPGIGLKTAQRIILELREKISGLKSEIIKSNISAGPSERLEQFEETEAALYALGYNNQEVISAVKWLTESMPALDKSDDMIREALIWLTNN